jgi:hypothetical protein
VATKRDAILPPIQTPEVAGMSPLQQNFIKLMTALIGVMVFLIVLSLSLGA